MKNPDGTPAGHHDFQNSLQSGGSLLLAGMLNSEFVPAGWMIALSGTTPICASSSANICGIVQQLNTPAAAAFCSGGAGTCVTGLTTAFDYVTPPVNLVLTASFTATQAGDINRVATELGACFTATGAAYSPQSCVAAGTPPSSFGTTFSSTAVTAIPVNAGQIVQVTVTFTFS